VIRELEERSVASYDLDEDKNNSLKAIGDKALERRDML
jgi:hypothetical protein